MTIETQAPDSWIFFLILSLIIIIITIIITRVSSLLSLLYMPPASCQASRFRNEPRLTNLTCICPRLWYGEKYLTCIIICIDMAIWWLSCGFISRSPCQCHASSLRLPPSAFCLPPNAMAVESRVTNGFDVHIGRGFVGSKGDHVFHHSSILERRLRWVTGGTRGQGALFFYYDVQIWKIKIPKIQ